MATSSSSSSSKLRRGYSHDIPKRKKEQKSLRLVSNHKDKIFKPVKKKKKLTHWVGPSTGAFRGSSCTYASKTSSQKCIYKHKNAKEEQEALASFITIKQESNTKNLFQQILHTSIKTPSTPTAIAVLAMQGINSRRPPLATPPPSNYKTKNEFSLLYGK